MAQLKIKRLKEWANKRFSYKVILDGQEHFEIANGQERLISIDNPVTIQAKTMWGSSKKVKVDISNGNIKEIRISANKQTNIRFPIAAFSIVMICSVVNLIYPDNGAKDFMTGLLIGVAVPLLGLLTIWRDRFLDIELVTE
ncbi:hypothetical protein SanaruYs_07280 [Chryseotalea sanaruensis]|uniref:Uncharacterized protein n=1 Tax=Chryseotalea sanaruensis TaxID=2482724 RepID=A0A401U6G7_9BACT|nr:hypothetical protein [Chryseotalea sanaruensis]GCC50513.1 hypothetical protein SanaruYs_07280 [Chryseotalea sanaruensis]